MGSSVLSFGHYAPARRVTSAELEVRLGLEAGWIERRTGIRERRYAADEEALSDIAVNAGEMALSRAGFDRSRIALLVLATSTPDHLLPPTAPLVAHRLGLKGAGAIDMAGACSGFLHAFTYADAFARTHRAPVLVIAANILSRRTNPGDRSSVILFGDAAGAALVVPSDRPNTGITGVHMASDGAGYDLIKIEAGGSRNPFREDTRIAATLMRLRDGRAVFAKATGLMASSSLSALGKAGIGTGDVAHWVAHQANSRIISAVQHKLAIDGARTLTSIATYGNSSAATIPLTLSLAQTERSYTPGDHILMCAAGAGLTGGALVYRL